VDDGVVKLPETTPQLDGCFGAYTHYGVPFTMMLIALWVLYEVDTWYIEPVEYPAEGITDTDTSDSVDQKIRQLANPY
jgi:hypothetical protein